MRGLHAPNNVDNHTCPGGSSVDTSGSLFSVSNDFEITIIMNQRESEMWTAKCPMRFEHQKSHIFCVSILYENELFPIETMGVFVKDQT